MLTGAQTEQEDLFADMLRTQATDLEDYHTTDSLSTTGDAPEENEEAGGEEATHQRWRARTPLQQPAANHDQNLDSQRRPRKKGTTRNRRDMPAPGLSSSAGNSQPLEGDIE